MKSLLNTQVVKLPSKVSAIIKGRKVEIKGPRGILKQDFSHMQISIEKTGKKLIKVSVWLATRRRMESLSTTCSLIRNMIKGVTVGIRFKMRLDVRKFLDGIYITDRTTME
ncbi:hypothetical protein MXB_4664 [Myxobolus squamalis]|nr:hypothetical protein MXB_4664 [Myxobolus squamalis]